MTPACKRLTCIALVLAVFIALVVSIPVILTRDNDKSSSSTSNAADGQRATPTGPPSPVAMNPTDPPAPQDAPMGAPVVITGAPTNTPTLPIVTLTPTGVPTFESKGGFLSDGQVNGVDYYRCKSQKDDSNANIQEDIPIILLHGALFTRRNWRENMVLFCNEPRSPHLTVYAMDLDVWEDRNKLRAIMDELGTVPAAVVTPSASGFTMVDWIRNSPDDLADYVRVWIPIASPAVNRASNAEYQKALDGVSVMAVYGDGDSSGKPRSELLRDAVGAEVVELSGGHAVYLEAQEEFVRVVVEFLQRRF